VRDASLALSMTPCSCHAERSEASLARTMMCHAERSEASLARTMMCHAERSEASLDPDG